MARKKGSKEIERYTSEPAAPAILQPITETIEKNYMPYAMSVIISRALPEIDGFKPSHRKLLYTMYKMGLLTGNRTKSANVVGQTMKLNPHGDAAIYETLVRLTRANETLLHPLVDSKGSFGKQYSSEMAYAASRYTEVKLDPFCVELFRGIDKNAVDMVDNYDNTMKEPALLPTSFPNILLSPTMGIAVGMASKICSFNLAELCDGTVQMLKNPYTDVDTLLDIIKAPDFSGGGYILYNRDQLSQIYTKGTGSVRLRARYVYDKAAGCIDILEIPYSTTIELIMKAITDLVKEGKLKEVSDFRDEIDKEGFKLTLDIKKGTDPDQLMAKLYKLTPLEDTFSCNFNIILDGVPKTLGVAAILREWIAFRMGCVKRELTFDKQKKEEKLHLLLGLGKILLDIDKAIRIVRETENDKEVIPNLMNGFVIDQVQAEYIADIKLRNLNKEYIMNRIQEIESLQTEIKRLGDIIASEDKTKEFIAEQLIEIKKKYGKSRKTQILYDDHLEAYEPESVVENYNCKILLTHDGYFKKNTLLSLRGNDEQKLKDDDYLVCVEEVQNVDELLFFSDKAQVYKARVADFEPVKASALGDYIPAKLGFDEGEKVLFMKSVHEYKQGDHFIFAFENGKCVRVPVNAYQTKSRRKKLTNAYSDVSGLAGMLYENEPMEVLIGTNQNRCIVIDSAMITEKTTRSSQGITVLKPKKNEKVTLITANIEKLCGEGGTKGFRKYKIPAAGTPFGRSLERMKKHLLENE
ncbi:MAG: topoisomerase IV [Clostridiales bacterium]|nr:topoisomerase IV [Clostridiales bacterium]